MFPAAKVLLKEAAHIGHGAIIHGATIGKNAMVGMNSVIMDNAIIGEECIIGALSFVKANANIPPRSLLVGNPGRIIKKVTEDMIKWKTKGTQLYQTFPAEYASSLKEVEPLREIPENRPDQDSLYKTWNEIKDS